MSARLSARRAPITAPAPRRVPQTTAVTDAGGGGRHSVMVLSLGEQHLLVGARPSERRRRERGDRGTRRGFDAGARARAQSEFSGHATDSAQQVGRPREGPARLLNAPSQTRSARAPRTRAGSNPSALDRADRAVVHRKSANQRRLITSRAYSGFDSLSRGSFRQLSTRGEPTADHGHFLECAAPMSRACVLLARGCDGFLVGGKEAPHDRDRHPQDAAGGARGGHHRLLVTIW
jgi:hypothetical protein